MSEMKSHKQTSKNDEDDAKADTSQLFIRKNNKLIPIRGELKTSKSPSKKDKPPTPPKQFHKCPHCTKEFLAKCELKLHQKEHQEQFKCTICGLVEKTQQQLNVHKKLHENTDPLECALCNKQFKKKGALVRHMRIHVRLF